MKKKDVIERISVSDLIPYAKNSRTHTAEQVAQIAGSIKEFGFTNPVLIDDDNGIIAGHGRVLAAQKIGSSDVPCIRLSHLSETQKRAYVIADNKLAMNAGWDDELLSLEIKDLKDLDFDISLTGFDEMEVSNLLKEVTEGKTDPDEVPEPPEEPVTKPGDLWLLGDHRVLCGDSTNPDDVKKLMNETRASLIHADPPYGMGKEKDGVVNDNLYREKLDKFQMEWWKLFRKHSHDNSSAYIWGNAPDLWRLWYKGGLADSEKISVRNEICWDKKSIPGMKSDLMHQYPEASERCLYIQIGQQFIGNLNAADFPEVHRPILNYQKQELEKSRLDKKGVQELTGVQMYAHWFTESQFQIIGEKHYRKLQESTGAFTKPWRDLKAEWDNTKKTGRDIRREKHREMRSFFDNSHEVMRDTWEFSRVHGDERHGHATPKPVEMMERIIKSSCPLEEVLVEPFLGSGSTLIGAEKTDRKCYGMEISPSYCDVIVKRWEDFTGKKAVLDKGSST